MSTPNPQLVDEATMRWYHCVSGGVWRARLFGDDRTHRKDGMMARLQDESLSRRPLSSY